MRLPPDLTAAGAAGIDFTLLCAGLQALQADTATARVSRSLRRPPTPAFASTLPGNHPDRNCRYALLPPRSRAREEDGKRM